MIDSETFASLTDEILDGWVRFVSEDGPVLSDWKGRTDVQMATITALTEHVNWTAKILLPVLPDHQTIARMLVVRSIFGSTFYGGLV